MFDKEKKELTDKINPECADWKKKIKISAECVDEEFEKICEHYRVDLDRLEDSESATVSDMKYAMRNGFLSFDFSAHDGSGEFIYKMWQVAEIGSRRIEELHIWNTRAEMFINIEKSSKSAGNIESGTKRIASCIRESESTVKKFSDKDIIFLGVLVSFFFS